MKIVKQIMTFVLIALVALPAFAQIPPELLERAEAGEAIAQFNLGVMYRKGEGVPQDYEKAVEWTTKAANQGDVKAQYNLGLMYAKGEGVPQDIVTGCAWIYASGEPESSVVCDPDLTPEQKAKALDMKNEIVKRIVSGSAGRSN